MEHDPQTPPYSTGDQTSFAYISARDRWPVILTGAIDDLHRTVLVSDGQKQSEGKGIIEGLSKLKHEVQHDRELTPLADDGQPDITVYNQELESLHPRTWFSVPWLYAECYLYRRLNTLFSLSKNWKTYDVFNRQKSSTFKSSRPAVLELAAKYKELVEQLDPEAEEHVQKLLFTEMCEICLWGNATDLSLLTSLSYEDIQKLQGSDARKASEKNIIANDLPVVYDVLKKAQSTKKDRQIDIVLDNSGFELYVDLILACHLLSTGLATSIVLHPKSIPWFVSDVLPSDFASLLDVLGNAQTFYTSLSDDDKHSGKTPQSLTQNEVDNLTFLQDQLSAFHREGQLIIRPNRFWTQAGSYWRLPKVAPQLYEDFKESELVIFKGDLNYRKLTGDVMWDPTTSFVEALGPLGDGSGVRTLALRTCKADVVVGLSKGRDEELRATEGGGGDSGARKWAWSGKWAMIQFCDGR